MSDLDLKQLRGVFDTGFDRALTDVEVLEAEGGRARLRLRVTESVRNLFGNLHGGAIATLIDDAGTMAILSGDREHRPGVSVDLNVSYLSSAPLGSTVVADAMVLKTGRTLAFVEVNIRRESDGVLVATGRMTKHLG